MSKHDDDTCPHLVRASLLEAENARLKAEVERLRVGRDWIHRVGNENGRLMDENKRLKESVQKLCEEVSRLHMNGYLPNPPAAKEGKPSV